MGKWSWLLVPAVACVAAALARGQAPAPTAADLANVEEDVRGLSQKVADLSLRVEQLEAENAALRQKLGGSGRETATAAQVRDAVSEVRQYIDTALANSRDEVLKTVDAKLERLQAAAGSPAAPAAAKEPVPSGKFSDDFPKQGISYVVQKGDTVASIAKRNGSKFRDIVNANRLADPSHIWVGETLFIPQGSK